MKFIRYSKFKGFDVSGLSLGDLMEMLQDSLLSSGFDDDYYWTRQRQDPDTSLDALRQALLQALLEMGELSERDVGEMLAENSGQFKGSQLEELLNRLIERLVEEGYLKLSEEPARGDERRRQRGRGHGEEVEPLPRNVKFEVTEKGLDFLGYKTLRNLLGSLGKSSVGRHDTPHLSTGVEASQSPKLYEFGDTINLDVNTTLLSAIKREGLTVPLNLEYRDLHVHQQDYQSSCATVVMLDCSHSMILDAEELPLARLATTQVGPYHTNTAEGLKLARRLLQAQRKEMKQIVMVTDGKPTACFLDAAAAGAGGRRLPFGEVQACRNAGIQVNTFMLASDHYLVDFVKQMSAMTSGKAYFATPGNLTQFVLIDFLRRKKSRVK